MLNLKSRFPLALAFIFSAFSYSSSSQIAYQISHSQGRDASILTNVQQDDENDGIFGCYWDSSTNSSVCYHETTYITTTIADAGNYHLTEELDLPIDFQFYGEEVNTIKIAENGYVLLNPSSGTTSASVNNSHLPSSSSPANDAIYAFWSNSELLASFSQNVGFRSGQIQSRTVGEAPNRTHYIRWNKIRVGDNNLIHFTLALHETTNVIEVILEGYTKLSSFQNWDQGGHFGTVGVEKAGEDGQFTELDDPFSVDGDFPEFATFNQGGLNLSNETGYYVIIFTPGDEIIDNISENKNTPEFLVYPNPASNLIQISSSSLDVSNKSVEIYDSTGRLVLNSILASELTQISIENLNRGIYTLKIIDQNNQNQYQTERLVKT